MPDTHTRRINADFLSDPTQDLWIWEEVGQDRTESVCGVVWDSKNSCFKGRSKARINEHDSYPEW